MALASAETPALEGALTPSLIILPEACLLVFNSVKASTHSGDAIRRFSEPALGANREHLAAHITSARIAYAEAFASMQRSSRKPGVKDVLENTSANNVAETAMELARSEPSETSFVSKFVGTLHHYHSVFDVLSQADFSYLTLIWGGMKLILIMAKNHSDMLTKLTDMLVEIGLDLSRVEVYLKLYPTARMVELTSMLYAAVVKFLQEVVAHFQRSAVLQKMSSMIRPFEEKFGRATDRIRRLENTIQKDALLLLALQRSSLVRHEVDSLLQRQHVETTLGCISSPSPHQHPRIQPKLTTLFQGFEYQATYHDSLAATYSVTSGAWKQWFAEEQRYLPSDLAPTTRLTQGICDAPDAQHALQWVAQQRALSPHIPSAYIIWARGMTAHSAIASLIFQILQQRPVVISQHNLDMRMFMRANASVKALWDMFVHLMRVLGGCLIYITMGSVGPDEFAVVEKFVKTVQAWDGPPISVTIIHPYNEGFTLVEDATDLDSAYDVHPSLTTTDALHHVLMLELDVHEVSDTIRNVLWESIWRETRYATIGVAFTAVTEMIASAAEEHSRQMVETHELAADVRDLWLSGVRRWLDNRVAANSVREQMQRHLDIVELELRDDVRDTISRHVKLLVFRIDTDRLESLSSRSLTQPQRDRVWGRMQEAIRPGTVSMFCASLRDTVAETLNEYAEVPPRNAQQATVAAVKLLNGRFGWNSGWRASFSTDKEEVVKAIVKGINVGFVHTIHALLEPQDS
ncbi:hypothetical protein GE09DRAFT_1203999 [Coniochaeta sp. 2T2.1]|nr:hypothetical protein GE09DRAFT_1203999 [Coniochaeta sp. 2T2.1]